MRNRQMIVRWLMANTKAIERADARRQDLLRDGRSEGVPRRRRPAARRGAAHQVGGRLRRRRKQLFETYGVHFDPKLRDEVVARVDKLNLPSYTGFVMPKLEAVTDADGEITDVTISYPLDLTTQMLEYSAATRHLVLCANESIFWLCGLCAVCVPSLRAQEESPAAARTSGWRCCRPRIAARRTPGPGIIRSGMHGGERRRCASRCARSGSSSGRR